MSEFHTGDIVDIARRGGSTMRAVILGVAGNAYDVISDLGGRYWAYEEQLTLVESHDQRRANTAAVYGELAQAVKE